MTMTQRSSTVLIATAAAATLATDPVQASTLAWVQQTDQPGWLPFFGRLHLVVLHLPIGLLTGAFVLELFGVLRRSKGYDVASAWLFLLGALSAWAACTTGWLYQETAGMTGLTLEWHKWLGIALSVLATVAACLKITAVRRQWKPAEDGSGIGMHPGGAPLWLARLGIIGVTLIMPVAGHLGGNLVHEPDKLTEFAPFKVPEFAVRFPNSLYGKAETKPDGTGVGDDGKPVIQNASLQVWRDEIQPILNAKCVECHGETKERGGYRLDTLEFALLEGDSDYMPGFSEPPDANIVPGSRILSDLYYRVAVPTDHEEFMPTKGEHMTPEEVELLGNWIDQFDGSLEAPEPTEDGSPPADGTAENDPEPEPELIAGYDPLLEREIEQTGASVQPISQEQDSDLMRVTFAFRSEPFKPGSLQVLVKAADAVAQLELQGTVVSDDDLADLPDMSNLVKLNLKDTPITDAGLANLPEMPALEWINLFGTQITDAGLEQLASYTSLKKVYLADTPVSAQAVDALKLALPEADILSNHQFSTEFDLSGGTPAPEPEPAPTPEANAPAPVNTKCPVTGADINAQFTSIYQGKTVAFCCGNCKAKFDENPAAFADKLE
ncbi:MAG: DUF2231 domain-containing protein [Planctomycetota bacterium]